MSGAPQPRMHGATHVCGGSDPIPGICDFISGSGFGSYRDCVLGNAALVGYWPLDDSSGNVTDLVVTQTLTFHDNGYGLLSYGSPGPFAGTTAIENSGPEGTSGLGNAGRFSDYVATSISDAFNHPNPFTVECWVYITAYSSLGGRRIFQFWSQSPGSNIFAIDVDNSGHIAVAKGTDGVISGVIPTTSWTHVRVTFDGTDLRLYIDTVLTDTAAAPDVISGGPFVIANTENASSAWRPFAGRISDLAVYNDALTTFCSSSTPSGPAEGASAGDVLTADGAGGTLWAPVTLSGAAGGDLLGTYPNPDVAIVDTPVLGSGTPSSSTFLRGDRTWATISGGDPADDTAVWMPLFDLDGGVVLDGDGGLIPTLIAIT